MREFGALGFTDGNKSVSNARVMKRALNYAKSFDGLIIQHAEEPELSQGGMVNDCLLYTSPSPRDQRGSGLAAWG